MKKALVIGNGESRAWFKPCHQTILDKDVMTWGCNAIYRDGHVHNLIAMDYAMQQEIYNSDLIDLSSVTAYLTIAFSCTFVK